MNASDLATLRAACSQPYGFWLDSALVDGRLGRRSFWGAEPDVVLRSWGREGWHARWLLSRAPDARPGGTRQLSQPERPPPSLWRRPSPHR